MKKIWLGVFSSKLSMLLLFALIIFIGGATFIENIYDTDTAKSLIYNTIWFELILISLLVLYIGIVIKKSLFSIEKLPQLIFHISFILIIIGGGITRYFGFEADMHINENETVDVIYTSDSYLNLKFVDDDTTFSSNKPIYFSQIGDNTFNYEFKISENEKLELNYKDYIYNYKKDIDALSITVSYKGINKDVTIYYNKAKYIQEYKEITIDKKRIEISYGPKKIKLPFSIKLNKFTLEKYPGTDLPSASQSKITLIDKRNNLYEEHIISKNKILDYDKYRFFQSSFDNNEKGTILSVNYDYYGTQITYFGYILLVLGSVLILFSKKSNFGQLNHKIKEVRNKRKALITVLLFLFALNNTFAQNSVQNPISKDHSEKFETLLVQNYDGRFSSVHSLAVDVIHKISRKDNFNVRGKGKMDAMQVFLDIIVDAEFWKNQRIIIVNNESVKNILEISGKNASFNDFFDNNSYKLYEFTQNAFKKKASVQTKFDKEIIKLSERINIFIMIANGSLLKIFPQQFSENNKWICWTDSMAFTPLQGEIISLNDDLHLNEFNYNNLMRSYLASTIYARESNDYAIPNKILADIIKIQRQLTTIGILPSEEKIKLEIFYNKANAFNYLKYFYLILGLILIALAFIRDFGIKSINKLNLIVNIFSGIIILGFVYQTLAMILRWYISNHAPWSNGYEVLLLISWGSIFAGVFMLKHSKITFASTALLSSLMLLIAGLSYYDPQITNLTPVLKSNWLIIHVAVITIAYSFLSLSFLLGIINLIINTIRPKNKDEVYVLMFKELTYINEKFLTIGLFLTAIGTFLGGVWANESWGRYWGWDAKETWSLVIVLTYGLVLHLKYIPILKSKLVFNIASIISYFSVIMTFVGVNYYFKTGLHSYATDDPPIFPTWAWISIAILFLIIVIAVVKNVLRNNKLGSYFLNI